MCLYFGIYPFHEQETNVKKIFALLSAAVLAGGLAACGDDSSQGDGSGQMYDASLNGNPQSLDPQYADDESSNTVIANLYSGLMKLDAEGSVVPCNAADYEISADGTVYTFRLREDNYWFFDDNDNDKIEEGEYFPVTADDYVFAFRRILNPEMHSPYAESFTCIKGGRDALDGRSTSESIGVAAVDSFTLKIELEYACAEFTRLLAASAASPCNEEFFLSTKGRYGLDDNSVMSNGSFFVRQWFYDPYGKNNILYMKRNSVNSYEDDRVYPSYLSFTIERSEEDIAKLFKDESVDCMTVLDSSAWNAKKYNIEPQRSITLGLVFSDTDKACSDKSFRKALAMGLDRADVSGRINSDVTTAFGIIPPAVTLDGKSFRELADDSAYSTENSEEAVKAVAEARRRLNIETFDTIKILVSNDTIDSAYLHYITRHWQDLLGVYIGIEDVTEEEFEKRLAEGNYQIALYPLSGEYNSAVSVLSELAESGYAGADSSVTESLMRCGDSSQLAELIAETEMKLIEEYSFIPLFYKNTYLISHKECADIAYNPFSESVDFRAAKYFD